MCDSVLIVTLQQQDIVCQEANRKWLLTCKRSCASWSADLFNYIACAYNTAALPSLSTTSSLVVSTCNKACSISRWPVKHNKQSLCSPYLFILFYIQGRVLVQELQEFWVHV